jgi:hypothetical protein
MVINSHIVFELCLDLSFNFIELERQFLITRNPVDNRISQVILLLSFPCARG